MEGGIGRVRLDQFVELSKGKNSEEEAREIPPPLVVRKAPRISRDR
jgi:hypothetical protein